MNSHQILSIDSTQIEQLEKALTFDRFSIYTTSSEIHNNIQLAEKMIENLDSNLNVESKSLTLCKKVGMYYLLQVENYHSALVYLEKWKAQLSVKDQEYAEACNLVVHTKILKMTTNKNDIIKNTLHEDNLKNNLSLLTTALSIYEHLNTTDPSNSLFNIQIGKGFTLANLAQIQHYFSIYHHIKNNHSLAHYHLTMAKKHIEESIAIQISLSDTDPNIKADLAMSYFTLSKILFSRRQFNEATDCVKSAIEFESEFCNQINYERRYKHRLEKAKDFLETKPWINATMHNNSYSYFFNVLNKLNNYTPKWFNTNSNAVKHILEQTQQDEIVLREIKII